MEKKAIIGDIISTPGVFIIIVVILAAYLAVEAAISISAPVNEKAEILILSSQNFLNRQVELNYQNKTAKITIFDLLSVRSNSQEKLKQLQMEIERGNASQEQKEESAMLVEILRNAPEILKKEIQAENKKENTDNCFLYFSGSETPASSGNIMLSQNGKDIFIKSQNGKAEYSANDVEFELYFKKNYLIQTGNSKYYYGVCKNVF